MLTKRSAAVFQPFITDPISFTTARINHFLLQTAHSFNMVVVDEEMICFDLRYSVM
jgi:hypothetical protein